jgi:hypothetical protein
VNEVEDEDEVDVEDEGVGGAKKNRRQAGDFLKSQRVK